MALNWIKSFAGEARFLGACSIPVVALENPGAEDIHDITVADTLGSSFLLRGTLMHSDVLLPVLRH